MCCPRDNSKKKKSNTLIIRVLQKCDSDAIRTRDPQLRRLLLYPAELRNHPQWDCKVSYFSAKCKPGRLYCTKLAKYPAKNTLVMR